MVDADFRQWPDLAGRALGGSVLWANDELFAAADNLINPGPALLDRDGFGARGKLYDGWETRRRRPDSLGRTVLDRGEFDEVIVRLGVPGLVHGVVIDTAHFVGNFPAFASLDGATLLGYPDRAQVQQAEWAPLLARSPLAGDASNSFALAGVAPAQLSTHVRLRIYPDGGVARLRVHGEAVPDPSRLGGRIDLAATTNGGRIVGCSNMFYSSPANVLAPGRATVMSDGWETSRRRDAGNDWLTVALGVPGVLHSAIVDTSRFVGNAPGWARLTDAQTGAELLPLTAVQPDTEHWFRLHGAKGAGSVTQVRLDAYPDGGLSRLRLLGEISAADRAEVGRRWLSLLPAALAEQQDPASFFD